MKYLIYIVIFIAIYALFSYGRILYAVRYTKNPHIEQESQTIGTGPALRYIAAGDSTAVGEGASSVTATYTYKVSEALSVTHTVAYKNIGVRGATTSDVIANQLEDIIAFNPDVVTISIGANDATHLVSQTEIIKNYKKIIERLTTETQARIYITDIPNFSGASLLPWLYIQLLEYRSRKLNPIILDMEDSRVRIINIHDFGWSRFPDPSATYSSDNFHPNDIGYQNWTEAFLDKVK